MIARRLLFLFLLQNSQEDGDRDADPTKDIFSTFSSERLRTAPGKRDGGFEAMFTSFLLFFLVKALDLSYQSTNSPFLERRGGRTLPLRGVVLTLVYPLLVSSAVLRFTSSSFSPRRMKSMKGFV